MIGWYISLNETGSDYYLVARAVRNVVEYLSSCSELPNNINLPFNLPSPLPPFDSERPLQYSLVTQTYRQPSNEPFYCRYSTYYLSDNAQQIRNGISDNVVFSPCLIDDPPSDSQCSSFFVACLSCKFLSLSDGASAIQNGLHAAFSFTY